MTLKNVRAWLAKVRNARFVRFPTLTHMMFDPPRLRTKRLDQVCVLSDDFLRRLCRAYQAAELSANPDIWENLAGQSASFRAALQSSDLGLLREQFSDLFGGTALWGMAHTARFLQSDSPYGTDYFPLRCRDALLALAEALAVRGLTSNQQTPWGDYADGLNGDLAPLLAEVEAALGHSIEPPSLGGPPVAEAGKWHLNPDAIRHAYIMYRIQQLGIANDAAILEIGGGFGCVARYAYLRGFRNYTIIDLPFANAIQAAFLADDLGEDIVSLHGEEPSAPIRIVPSTAKETLAASYELVVNMDSLPEIAEAGDYVKLIQHRAKLFLSVNQEANRNWKGFQQCVVPRLLAEIGGFKRLSRHPYWMEQGYAEELYSISR